MGLPPYVEVGDLKELLSISKSCTALYATDAYKKDFSLRKCSSFGCKLKIFLSLAHIFGLMSSKSILRII